MKILQMKRYGILLAALVCICCTGCTTQQATQQGGNASQSISSENSDDSGENNEQPNATPIPIHVFDMGTVIAVTEKDLTDITLSEDEEFMQVNNNIVNGNFIHPYQDGYYYRVEKGGDGPESVMVYDDGQGQITDRSDLSDYILYLSNDSFYYPEECSLKWKNGDETQNIITGRYGSSPWVCLTQEGIYYTDVDEENKMRWSSIFVTLILKRFYCTMSIFSQME